MFKINSTNRIVEAPETKDIKVQIFNKRLYFNNIYHIITLINDILVGVLYVTGSLANLLGWPAIIGQVTYLLGGLFLLFRPIINLGHNISIYNRSEKQKEDSDRENEESVSHYNDEVPSSDQTKDKQKNFSSDYYNDYGQNKE